MSTTDPTGEGGGGGGEGAMSTNAEQNASPSTPNTGATVPVQATTQQQQQHPPPSPLSGCYLLVVLPEPHTAQHKDLILNRLAKGFLSWDKDSCHVDLEKELLALVAQAPEGEEARNGERLIQYATENLVTEVLIHPQTNTLLQCIRNLLASFTKHRHIIHAGYTFGGNGSWILQDGTFSLADFLDAFSEHEVQRVLRAYENSVTVDIHCAGVGDWTTSRLSKEACCRFCRVRVNPDDVLTAGMPAITSFTNYIGQYLVPQTLDQLMEPSDVVGNIRFSHPTLYVFPGGQGDAALFGINGFNMLVDGGFARKACFWDFTRHLDRLDAVLVTRINNSNIGGMFSVLRKKKELHVYPQIGHFFCNLVERRQSNSPDGDKDIDPLILNLTDIGQEMVLNLRHINLRAHPCYRDSEPINLYHKVGHGTLDMYVLSPSKDSREVREFLSKWHASDSKLFAGSHKKDSNNLTFPIQNLVSICALLVWQPANPEDNITRILFPGSTPQHKIFEGFERLKHLDFLKHPVCSAKTLSPSTSLATLRDKPIKKFGLIEKESKKISEPKKEKREPSEPKSIKPADETISKTTPQSTPIIPTSKLKTETKMKKVAENKKIETEAKESKKIEKELKDVRKESKREIKVEKREDEIKKGDLIKLESDKTAAKEIKESKVKPEPKKKEAKESKIKTELKKSEITPKPKSSEKRAKPSGTEKKDAVKSSPTTPKKTLNGTATRTEISKAPKTKLASKAMPSLPAKSAKEANNRKVVEQKKSEVEKSAVKDVAAPAVKVSAKPKPTDRKPISRRTKPVSPSKARMPGSPAKSTRSTPTTSVKSDKDGVIRKVKGDKGTTDSSTVSTPSGIEPESVKPIDKSLIEQSEDMSLDSIESKVLADLKEEREVVEEIEAVLQKAERIEEIRKDDRFEGDDEITAEAIDKKEEDITEEDVTAEIEDMPKKEGSRKESQELTEEDEYLIVEKEEVYTEDSAQSGEGEQKHVLDEAESEKVKVLQDTETIREKGQKEEPEEKGKDESPEKKIDEIAEKEEIAGLSSEHKEQLQKEVKEIIASAAEIVQKAEEKDDSAKKDSEDITKEPSSLSPDKLDSSEKKTDTDVKPDVDQKEHILEKREESQERISTIESGATTTAPTLPEDERIPLDEIKEDIDEKHVIEEVKEKDAPMKLKEEVTVPETVVAKPEVKVFDVRQAMQNLQRDIVKTPDEVADLPVHEEVDPKLYRMEDFEKGKEEKPSPTTQEIKELPTPPVKEQKGVFSFFGKVADKFEKGIDKLTKKSKKESDKDSDEKSSSKSSSPKEAKLQEKTLFEEVDVEKMFPKVGKPAEKPEIFEEVKPTIVDVKTAAIKDTAAFIQEEILDAQKKSVPDIEEKLSIEKLEDIKKAEAEIEEALFAKDISPKPVDDKEIVKEIELLKEEDIGEDAEEVKALLEEASKKFKTVKDSLRDSLESLEEKVKEEEMQHDVSPTLKDIVKDTLEGVAEKLEEIKPHIESSLDIKEPEKVKFAIPKDEEFEEEYEEEPEGPYRDMKEAVRDVGEVLAGTAGINLEDKPKDVIEIVKKVAEVLKEDDFLSDKTLFDQASKEEEISSIPDEKPSEEEISTERKPSIPSEKITQEKDTKLKEDESKLAYEDIVTSKKIDVAEVLPVHEKVEELIEKSDKLLVSSEKPDAVEVKEEPCVKMFKKQDDLVTSPMKDVTKDKKDVQQICAEMLKDDEHICEHKKLAVDDTSQVDVMQAGIESICVKEMAKRPSFEDKLESDIEHPVISFEQKVSPAKAEIVMVTPGSTPTSPKFSADKIYDKELEIGLQELPKLPDDIKQVLSKEAPVEEVIEELIITKKKKITIEVIEYITVVKRIPRERVIYIIEEIIVKKGLSRESVVDDPEILKLKEDITPEKRMEVEDYIVNEYIIKEKRITIEIIEEISIKKIVPKKIVIEIIEEIIVKRKIARHMVLDIPEEVLSEIIKEESPEESAEEQITPKIDITAKRESIAEVSTAPTEVEEPIILQKHAEIEEFVVNEYVTKGKKITASIIDEISAKKAIPKTILVEIIEEIIVKKKIPRNVLLDVTEEELDASMISKTTPEEKEEKEISETEMKEKRKSIIEVPSVEISEMKEPITPQQRAEIEEYIVEEYVTKGDSINVQKLEEICSKKKISKRIIIEIIEEIIIKRKIPRHTVLGITEEELSHIIKEEVSPELEVLAEKRKSIAEVLSPDEKKKIPVELKKEPEHEVSEEKLSPTSEKDIVEEEEEEEEVDGFVSIPRKSFDEKKKEISPIKTEVLPVTAKEHEKDVIDDFEAVEQEYKVHDVSITSPEKADEMKEKEDIEETAEDTMSEVIEADEKFVQETKEKVGKEEPRVDVEKDTKLDDKKRELEEPETSEISEIVDTTEKYLDEAKEKTDDVPSKEKSLIEKVDELKIVEEKEILEDISDKRPSIDIAAVPEAVLPSTKLIDEKAAPDETKEIEPAKEKVEELITKDDKSKPTSPIKDETKDIVFLTEKLLEKVEGKPETKEATDFAQEPTTELLEDIESKLLEPTEIKETPITKEEESSQEPSEEALHKKTSISKEPEDEIIKPKDEPHVEDVKPLEKIKDEKYLADKPAKVDEGSGTVKRMLVTACSEDGREETEICPTGSITFMKTVTPDDSLKDVSVKSTPDKDSLLLDKDSLHSSVSTPEKDSISEKSVPEGKDKITPEDSLEKSPRDSQDLEDSLEKLELQKPKDVKIPLIDDNKPKAPEKSEDIIKPKSPMEKEDLKAPDKIAAEDTSPEEKRIPESPVKDTEIDKVKLVAEETVEKIEKPKSPTKDMEKIEKSPSPSEIKHEDVQKSKVFPDTTAEKSPVESTEKPTLPIEKAQSEKIGTGVSKTPESLRSEDVSPAETIFSKSPTDKPEMHFTKTSISEEDVVSEAVTEKLSESIKEIKSMVDKELESKEKTPSPESKDQMPEKLEMKELDLKPTSPVIVTSTDEKAPLEKSISPSISEKHEEKDVLSISSEKSDDKSICSKSPVSPDKEEKEDVIDKHKLPSIVSESIDKKMSEVKEKPEEKEPVDKSKTPSITSEKSEQDIKSPDSVLSDKTEEKETVKLKSPSAVEKETISEKLPILESEEHYDEKGPIDEVKSPSAISDRSDEKKEAERSKSPSIATDKSDLQDVTEHYLEKQKSPIFDRPESPKDIDKTEEQDKSRSPSVASDKSDSKKVSSRSPSISVEKIDLKDMDLPIERAQSPSIAIDKDDKLEELPISKSLIDKTEVSKDAQKSPKLDEIGLKEIQLPLDKSRSSSVTSTISESKESGLKEKSPSGEFLDKSKSPSPVDQKLDVEEKESSEKSRSPSIVKEQHIPQEIKKSPSSVEEKLKDLTQEPIDKSRSSSVSSIVTDEKEPADHLKSSSTVDEKPDLKGVEEPSRDKSRSPSVISVTEEQKEPIDLSKSPSIAGEKLDLKDIIDMPPDKSRSSSITSVTSTQKAEHSKSPSIAGEKPDIKDVTESVTDKSRSPSVISIAEEKKEPFDHSKSPSVIDEKPDLKDVIEQLDEKFRSASVGSITSEQKETTDRSKSPSIAGEKPDLKDVVDQQIEKAPSDKSKSPSAVSDSKEPEERSKSPSIAEEKSDEKEPTADKSRSTSVVSITSEQKETTDRSKSPSIADEKPDLKDIVEPQIEKIPSDKSKSPSAMSDSKEPEERSKSPSIAEEKSDEKEPTADKSRSTSVVSITSDQKETIDRSKSPSIAGEKPDLKDIVEQQIEKTPSDKSKSPSAMSDSKEPEERSKSPSIAEDKPDEKEPTADKSRSTSVVSITSEQKETTDRSKSPSIADEKPDLKDIVEPQIEKIPSDKSKSPSAMSDSKEPEERSKSPSIAEEKSDEKEPTADKSRSTSVVSITSDQKETIDRSKSPSIAGEKPDLKDIVEQQIEKTPSDKSKSPSAMSDSKEPEERSKSPSIAEDKPDEKEPTADKSRSTSVVSITSEQKETTDRSKSPSIADEKPDLKDIVEQQIEKTPSDKSKSPSAISDSKEPEERSKSPSIAEDKSDEKEPTADKSKSTSVISITSEQKETTDRSKSPSIADEKPDLKDVVEQQIEKTPSDKSKSPTVMSDSKEPEERSKSPSIAEDKSDEKEPTADKSRSASVVSITSEQKETTDRSKSPSIAGEKPDLKDVVEQQIEKAPSDKSKSPSAISDSKEPEERLKSPSIAEDKSHEKELTADKSRSASVVSITSEPKEITDRSKSPSIAGEKPDLKDIVEPQIEKTPSDKSKSPTALSDSKEPEERSKSPSIAEDKLDEKELMADKSRSASVVSITSEQKETTDRSKSPSIAGEKPDLKDIVEQQIEKAPSDKSKSPSAMSDSKEPEERSKSPSIAEDKLDEKEPTADKSRSTSVISITSEQKETTDRSKSPSIADEKPDLKDVMEQQIEKAPSDKSKSPTALSDSKEPEERSKSPSIAEDKSDEKEPTADKSRSVSVVSITSEQKETIDRSKSPSIADEKPDLKDVVEQQIEKAPSDKSKSPSAMSDSKEPEERSKSPSIAEDKLDEKEPTADKSRSTSVISITSEQKETTDRSKSPSIADEKPDLKDVMEQQIEKTPSDKSKSPTALSDSKEPEERSKSPSIAEDKLDEKEPTADKSRSTSVISITSEPKEITDRSKSPSIAGEKPDLKDIVEQQIEKTPSDKSKSPTALSDSKEPEERLKSPSIAEDKSDEKELTADKSRSASVVSITSEPKEITDRSKSPSIAGEKPDLKDIVEQQIEKTPSDKSKSPTALSDSKEPEERLKSPSIAEDKSDEKEPTADKSRSASVVSITSEPKEITDRSKSPSIAGEKPDLKDIVEQQIEKTPSDKSKSPTALSDSKEPEERLKSPSIAEDKSDEKEPTADKSRSASVVSITSEPKEIIDRSKSPSIADEKPDLKDVVEQQIEKTPSDKSKSPTALSDSKEPEERSKSPSIVEDKLDEKEPTADKSRSTSVVSITSEQKETTDRSKSPSIADEKPDLKDVVEQQIEKTPSDKSKSPTALSDSKEPEERLKSPSIVEDKSDEKEPTTDKSRSASVVSITGEAKEITDRSKSPSIASEKPDLKDVVEQQIEKTPSDKSKSPTALSDSKEPEERSKSPSIAEDKSDEKEPADKSRSTSVVSITSEQKETTDRSKSPSIADEKAVLKDVEQVEKLPSDKSDDKKSIGDSKSSSITEDKSDLTDVTEHPLDKSKSSSITSITSDQKEPTEKAKSVPDKEDGFDRSKSPSVASEKSEGAKSIISSKPSSVAGDTADLSELPVDKSRSPSVISVTTDQKETIEIPVSPPTVSQTIKEPHDRSKSPSIASEKSSSRKTSITEDKPDLKDIIEPIDKSRSSSVVSLTTEKAESKSISLTTSDKLEPPVDRSKSPSTASDKSDEKVTDSKVGTKEYYEDASDKSPNLIDVKPSTVIEKLDIKSDDDIAHDKSQSTSIVLDKRSLEKIDIDGLKTSEQELIDKTRSLSIISDKTEPKSPSDISKSPSLADDKFDQKEKSRSSSVASEKLEDIDAKIAPSLDTGKIPKDESAKSSRASSPLDKTPKDRSRSQSVIDIGDKIPASRSRTASLFDDKLPEKVLPQDEKDTLKHTDAKQSFDEKDEDKSSSQEKKSPATSPEMIQKEMRKIREKRFADFGEPGTTQPRAIEKADDEEEDIVKVTAEKKAEIEKYILEEFIVRKKKISLIVIEKLVMTYSVPQFIVMEIIEDIISRQNIPKSTVFDFVDDESSEPQYEKEMATLPPQKKADVEKYITEEFIAKKKKVTPESLEEIVILKGLPRYIIITIIEEIIVTRHIPRNTLIEGDLEELREKSPDIIKKRDESIVPADLNLEQTGGTQEYLREKPSATVKDEDGKISPTDSAQDTKALSASPSLSPEPIPSDKSTQDSPVRSEPHIDEEILISEEKRTEIEKLLEEEYIKKGRRITEVILEEIIIRTSLPRYIILEIVEEIILKRKIPRESVVDVEIYQEEEPEEDYDKAVYGYDRTADVSYELPHDARKSSIEYRMSGIYAEPSERQLDKSDYPIDYESQFHKAFVDGMTEMRTTHITTLSGKSTPEFAHREDAIPWGIEADEPLPGSTLTTARITDVEDSKIVQPMQTVTILRESKITEPHLPEESPEKHDAKHEIIVKDESGKETTEILKEDESSDEIVIKKIVKREILEQEEAETEASGEPATKSDSDVIVVKKIIKREIVEPQEESESVETKETKRPSVQQDEPDAITKIIKREIVEYDEPEVVTKVVKREIIEQDEPEIITKVIRREIVVPDEETSDSKEDSGEYVKTITTKTTRTILTEELPDTELSQTDPSKIYKDPTSGTTYRVVSDESVPDVTSSADVKRIVTTVTTITGPDGKVTTKKDVKESTDTVDSEKLLEELIDSDKMATETTKSAEKIIKETITTVTSGTSTPDAKIYDSGKSTPDLKQGDKFESTVKERLGADKFEHSVSPLVRDLISDDKSYSGKSSPDMSLPKDIVFSGSTGKSTPEIPMSPLIRDGAAIQPHLSGRSTPDRRSDGRSSTGTPEGFRSGEVIRTTITTTKMISDEGEIVTTTREITESTNEKGETVVLAEKTDVKVDERLPSKDAAESAINNIIGSIKSSESQRSGSPASDDATSDKGDPSSEHGSKIGTQWGSREERHTFSDDEPPSSPLSSTSQVGYSPQTTHRHEPSSDKEDEQKEQQVEFSAAAMSSSFYGELPAVPAQISAMKTFHGETGVQKSSDPVHSRFMVEKEFAGYGEKPDAKRYVDEADLDFDKALMEHKEMKEANGAFSSGIAPRYTNGSLRHEDEAKDHPSSSFRDDKDDSKGDSKKDPLEGWGTPLGLPSPKPPKKFNLKNPAQASCSSESTSDVLNFDVLKDWGEPLRLPSPAPTTNEVSNKGAPGTPKKERKQAKKVQSENIKNKKRSESPGKNEKKLKDSKNKIQPVYMDLAYVPHHGNSYYTSLEFFKRVRARYYVFSGTEPSREVYDALLEAKKTWEDKDLEVTMIPTYDTDTLGYWVADNEEALAANHIDLSPSASRCTINLQDHETSCSAYRLEF